MAFNNYITLDGKRYKTKADSWSPEGATPSTVRVLQSGDVDATFGPGSLRIFGGEIMVDITPPSGSYGTPDNLRTSLEKRTGLTFVDHYGTSYTVYVQGYKERSLSPVWTQPDNTIDFSVTLIAKAP